MPRRSHALAPTDPPFEVVLVEPEIPPNTGNVARLCACTGARLHLVCPLGFALGDKDLRRAGLDYWDRVHARTWSDLAEFEAALDLAGAGGARVHLFAAKAERSLFDVRFRPGDVLVFGRESRGLPEPFLERHAARTVALPMLPGNRSLNLSNCVATALYEALRQAAADPWTPPGARVTN